MQCLRIGKAAAYVVISKDRSYALVDNGWASNSLQSCTIFWSTASVEMSYLYGSHFFYEEFVDTIHTYLFVLE